MNDPVTIVFMVSDKCVVFVGTEVFFQLLVGFLFSHDKVNDEKSNVPFVTIDADGNSDHDDYK